VRFTTTYPFTSKMVSLDAMATPLGTFVTFCATVDHLTTQKDTKASECRGRHQWEVNHSVCRIGRSLGLTWVLPMPRKGSLLLTGATCTASGLAC